MEASVAMDDEKLGAAADPSHDGRTAGADRTTEEWDAAGDGEGHPLAADPGNQLADHLAGDLAVQLRVEDRRGRDRER